MPAFHVPPVSSPTYRAIGFLVLLGLALCAVVPVAGAAEPKASAPARDTSKPDIEATSASSAKDVGEKVREALGTSIRPNKKLIVNLTAKGAGSNSPAAADTSAEPAASASHALAVSTAPAAPAISASARRLSQARAMAPGSPTTSGAPAIHDEESHWTYDGEKGPQAWGRISPAYKLCASGRRQSPISIEDSVTLQGPAEPIQFRYGPSNATVVNNGHTIQVDVQGDNTITVRGSRYQLLQFHFHTPSEEQINAKRFPMVAHLVHRNAEGQLAVVAVLLDTGEANTLIDKVWTYMPLDTNDTVRMPAGLLNLADLLPADQRYYQFLGSLTTPPCSEGVLWMVLKTPVSISRAQLKLFTQLYPDNARPLQPLNARPVRDAQ